MYVGNLANHMERHTGCSQVWCCSQCQSRFPSMTELTSHHCQELREQQQEHEEDCGQYTNGRVAHVSLPGSRNSQPFSVSSCGIEMPEEVGPDAISPPSSGKDISETHGNTLNTVLCPELLSDPASEVHKHKVPDSKTDTASEKKEEEEEEEVSENQVSEKPAKKGRKRKNLSPGMKEPPRPYKCSECLATFQHASVLKLHSQKHSGEKAFPCAQCQQSFTSKTKLLKHQEKDHWEGMPITCQECGKVFSTARGLDEHRVLHTGERPYVCETCGERFPYRTALTRHRRSHRDSYFRCRDCGAEFHLKSLYTNHVDEHHRAVKPHLCAHCGQAFGSLAALKRHADTHGKKQFVCELCGKEFRKRGEHKMHLLTHQSVKPFPCPLCPRSFVSRCKLKLHHSLTHLGIKPFACALCPATFSCATYLKDHARLAHSTERMFACPLCPSRFAARRFLRLHLKRTHKKSKAEVRNAERESLLGLSEGPQQPLVNVT